MADIKAFAKAVARRKTVIFALQKSIKHLSLLVAFRQTMFQIKPLLSAKTLAASVKDMTNIKDEKYNSVPFSTYFSERNGKEVYIDNAKRILSIYDGTGKSLGIVYYSDNINHIMDKDSLLGTTEQPSDKVYYVYKNGAKGHDWLWYYGDLIQLDTLL